MKSVARPRWKVNGLTLRCREENEGREREAQRVEMLPWLRDDQYGK